MILQAQALPAGHAHQRSSPQLSPTRTSEAGNVPSWDSPGAIHQRTLPHQPLADTDQDRGGQLVHLSFIWRQASLPVRLARPRQAAGIVRRLLTRTRRVDHACSSRRRRGHRGRWADEPIGSRRGGWSVCGSIPRSPALGRGGVETCREGSCGVLHFWGHTATKHVAVRRTDNQVVLVISDRAVP